jgi:AcrR family transcriptional regulator
MFKMLTRAMLGKKLLTFLTQRWVLLRLVLVERLMSGMPELEQWEGRDKAALDSLLARLVQELGVTAGLQGQELHARSQAREFQMLTRAMLGKKLLTFLTQRWVLLRQVLVERLVSSMPELEQCEGRDRVALDSLLARLVQELGVTAGLQGQ